MNFINVTILIRVKKNLNFYIKIWQVVWWKKISGLASASVLKEQQFVSKKIVYVL